MKLLTPEHVPVYLRIEHPAYGAILIAAFQRNKDNLTAELADGHVKWCGHLYPVEKSVTNDIGTYLTLPWDYQLPPDPDGTEI